MTILKVLKHKYCLSLGKCRKYVVQFTDPTPTIYWYAQRAKLTFLNMPVRNKSNNNNVRVAVFETQCVIYRPDLPNLQASRKKLKK